MDASLGTITGIDRQNNQLKAALEPSGYETGWLPCLFAVGDLVDQECLVVPCGTFGQALVIPFPLPMARKGEVVSASPLVVHTGGKDYTCDATVFIGAEDVSKTALMQPVLEGGYIVTGVIR